MKWMCGICWPESPDPAEEWCLQQPVAFCCCSSCNQTHITGRNHINSIHWIEINTVCHPFGTACYPKSSCLVLDRINDSEYYIEFSRFASCTTSDAQNYYIKIPGKGELTLPKQEGSDKIKPNSSIIEYGNSTYIKIAALNFTTEIKDNKLWLK